MLFDFKEHLQFWNILKPETLRRTVIKFEFKELRGFRKSYKNIYRLSDNAMDID